LGNALIKVEIHRASFLAVSPYINSGCVKMKSPEKKLSANRKQGELLALLTIVSLPLPGILAKT
jgi:hypothetical protein